MEAGLDAFGLEIVVDTPDLAIRSLSVTGESALESWNKARRVVPEAGCWPVLIGTRHELEDLVSRVTSSSSGTSEILERAESLPPDPVKLAELRHGALLEALKESRFKDLALDGPGSTSGPLEPMRWRIAADQPEVLLAFVPAPVAWQVPALLKFGSSAGSPPPEEHVALMKHWGDAYGAELVGMTRDTVELQVARPPADKAAALALGSELVAYCPRFGGTPDERAQALVGCGVWSFRW
jgi:hypothetical protein